MISAMSSEGGTVGGTGPRAGCSPLLPQSSANREQYEAGWTRQQFVPTAISAASYWRALRAALFAARADVTRRRDGQWQYRGVSDPEI